MAAKKKPLDIKAVTLTESRVSVRRLALPPERAAGRIVGEGVAPCPRLSGCRRPKPSLVMPNVLVFAETREGALRKVALEASRRHGHWSTGSGGGEVHAALVGAARHRDSCAGLGEYGADVVVVVEHPALERYNPEACTALVADRLRSGGYRAGVFRSSVQGRDLAPRVAGRLGVPVVTDVTALRSKGDALVVTHPIDTGKVIGTLEVRATPALAALRPGVVTPAPSPRDARIERAQPAGDPAAASRVVTTELKVGTTTKLDLGEAPVIVSGGRGLRSAENFRLVEDLAAAFGNAAVGATRAVTDDGWRPHSEQIGQTGRLVSPDLYVAVGISGADSTSRGYADV